MADDTIGKGFGRGLLRPRFAQRGESSLTRFARKQADDTAHFFDPVRRGLHIFVAKDLEILRLTPQNDFVGQPLEGF